MGVHEVVSTNNHLKMFIDLIFGVSKVFYGPCYCWCFQLSTMIETWG